MCLCPGRTDNYLQQPGEPGFERDNLRAGVEGREKGAAFGRR